MFYSYIIFISVYVKTYIGLHDGHLLTNVSVNHDRRDKGLSKKVVLKHRLSDAVTEALLTMYRCWWLYIYGFQVKFLLKIRSIGAHQLIPSRVTRSRAWASRSIWDFVLYFLSTAMATRRTHIDPTVSVGRSSLGTRWIDEERYGYLIIEQVDHEKSAIRSFWFIKSHSTQDCNIRNKLMMILVEQKINTEGVASALL